MRRRRAAAVHLSHFSADESLGKEGNIAVICRAPIPKPTLDHVSSVSLRGSGDSTSDLSLYDPAYGGATGTRLLPPPLDSNNLAFFQFSSSKFSSFLPEQRNGEQGVAVERKERALRGL